MSLTGKDIAEIARLLDESHFSSLDLQLGELKLRIRRDGAGGGRGWEDDEPEYDAPEELPAFEGDDDADAEESAAPASAPAGAAEAGEVDVVAPLLGNFYAAPRPGEDPFVQVGDTVTEDSVVAIIEVMKLMNSVRAGVAGTVTAVLAENGSAVEEGQPIVRVKTDG